MVYKILLAHIAFLYLVVSYISADSISIFLCVSPDAQDWVWSGGRWAHGRSHCRARRKRSWLWRGPELRLEECGDLRPPRPGTRPYLSVTSAPARDQGEGEGQGESQTNTAHLFRLWSCWMVPLWGGIKETRKRKTKWRNKNGSKVSNGSKSTRNMVTKSEVWSGHGDNQMNWTKIKAF